ncbi:potassium channel family protein [Mycoplasmopsis pullorum]|uniref:Ion transport domain-containing protein n=1 Tax=Mycoplasmopsis pullorum TaxID=48003 RepID=A0A1L4FS60_9BACT|nr:potassium channel family protein [Mycoplasmopsis pullorum]APJ38451.1 hypothetical protein BLA55_02120 [Mycoplasmopsis pullorum]
MSILNICKAINIIVTSDNELPKSLNKHNKYLNILKYIYIAILLFTVTFSFVSFAVPKTNSDISNLLIFISIATFFVFAIDFSLHWITCWVNKPERPIWKSFLSYPFTFTGIILILCMLPSLKVFEYWGLEKNAWVDFFKVLSFVRIIRLVLILKIYPPFKILINVFQSQKVILTYIFVFIVILIIVFALIIWNNETVWLENTISKQILSDFKTNNPNQEIPVWINDHNSEQWKNEYEKILNSGAYSNVVTSFFDSLYFSTITLTTIGYGDFFPHADASKFIVILISLVGIAIFAIPSGVIAGAMLSEMNNIIKTKKDKNAQNPEN